MNIAVPPSSLRPLGLEGTTRHERQEVALPPPLGLLAIRLLEWTRNAGEAGLIHVASSERRAEQLCRVVQALAPELAIHLFRPWDCLPYDRAPPSRGAMGHRVDVLSALTRPADAPRLVITTPDALVQRVPPRETWADAVFTVRVGETLDLERWSATCGEPAM
jgi:transcription-repair coupling factor (superfamily II helicase)